MYLNSCVSALQRGSGRGARWVRVFGALALVFTLSACRGQKQASAPAAEGAANEPNTAEPGQASKPSPHRGIQPRADELLRQTCALLAATPRFAFEAEETFDEVFERAPRLQLTNVRRVLVEKPGRLAAEAAGDTLYRAAWFDGRRLSVLNREENVYTTLDQPPTLDAALDQLASKYGVEVPLSDFVYSDPYAVLSEGALYGEYLGIHQAAGVDCHHLAFTQASIDWQMWIDAGEKPLPRKLVISYREEPGVPQYFAVIRKWDLEPVIPEGAFRFEPPKGAKRVEPTMFLPDRKSGGKTAQAGKQPKPGNGGKP